MTRGPKKSGVYLLTNEETRDTYVGATSNIFKRQSSHKYKEGFSLKVLELAPRSKLPMIEAEWIEKLKPNLNKLPQLTANAGVKRTWATKEKMSAWQKGKKKGTHGAGPKISAALKGIPKTEKHRKAAAKARKLAGNGPWTEKQRAANVWTDESREKLSKTKSGVPWTKARRDAQKRRNKNAL